MSLNVILITRPIQDGSSLAHFLRQRGFQTALAPMMDIIWHDELIPDFVDAQAIVFTSSNGVRAFSRLKIDSRLTVYAVGDTTAALARDLGFQDVYSADGNAHDLAHLITHTCRPDHGRFISIGGTNTRFADTLTHLGFIIDHYPLYEAVPLAVLPHETITLWQHKKIEAVLLFSPYTAHLFLQAMDRAHCSPEGRVAAFCLSREIAKVLSTNDTPWRFIAIASKPRQDVLLDLLDKRLLKEGACL